MGLRMGAGVTGRLGLSISEGKSVKIKLSLLSKGVCVTSPAGETTGSEVLERELPEKLLLRLFKART